MPDNTTCSRVHGEIVFVVPKPDLTMESVISLNDTAAGMLAARFNSRPSRATLHRWRDAGYPVANNGPRVRLPWIRTLSKAQTTRESLGRFLMAIDQLNGEMNEAGGNVSRWEKMYGERYLQTIGAFSA